MATEVKCYFETEAFAKTLKATDGRPADFKETMDALIETGASRPTQVSMSDWYYMQSHGKKCPRCKEKFEAEAKKARKNGPIDGPTVLD